MHRRVKRVLKYMDNKLFHQKLGGIRPFLCKRGKNSDASLCSRGIAVCYDSFVERQMKSIDIKKTFRSDRLDLCVRYLLFKDFILQGGPGINQRLFSAMACSLGDRQPQTRMKEAVQFYEKIRQNGMRSENIPIYNKDSTWHDDVRRLACFMALETAGDCPEKGSMDFKWFCDHNFSTEDKIRILRAYSDIHQNCGLFILSGVIQEQWYLLESAIREKLQIAGSFDLDFTDKDAGAFKNLIYDIYKGCHSYEDKDSTIHVPGSGNLTIRIMLVADEREKAADIYESMHNLKMEFYEKIKQDYHSGYDTVLVGTDSLQEFKDLSKIVLSVNNLKNINMRTNLQPRSRMVEMLNAYKNYMHEHDIDLNDTCIVGSTPLEVIGIREAGDIDIVVAPELREIYGNGVAHLTDDLDIAVRNYVRNSKKCLIRDEQLIYDDNYHFMFMGCKFVNIEYILYKKSACGREKDIQDVKLIRSFLKHSIKHMP